MVTTSSGVSLDTTTTVSQVFRRRTSAGDYKILEMTGAEFDKFYQSTESHAATVPQRGARPFILLGSGLYTSFDADGRQIRDTWTAVDITGTDSSSAIDFDS